MNRKDMANLLQETALYMELASKNPFKIRAYANAARSILRSDLLDADLENADKLSTIKGIGRSLSEFIVQAAKCGHIDALDDLKKTVPKGLVDMTRLPGIGPKKVLKLHQELGVLSLGELAYACNENRLVELKGFGVKTQTKISEGIEFLKRGQHSFLLPDAAGIASDLAEYLQHTPEAMQVELTGDLRRLMETVDLVQMLVKTTAPQAVITSFHGWVKGSPFSKPTEDRALIHHPAGPKVEIVTVPPDQYAVALVSTTGALAHFDKLQATARGLNLNLTDRALTKDGQPLELENEEAVYNALGLDWIPPELREGQNEVELAMHGRLPRLVNDSDIKGVFHVHTNASDGAYSLEEMSQAALDLGYTYLGLTDHSKSAFYAGGLTDDQLLAQADQVAELNEKMSPFKIFHGVESDILVDGSLDYSEATLNRLDFVIASIHSNFGLDAQTQTKRLIKAISNPATTILGHPTGRLLLARPGYGVDMDSVAEACAEHGVAMEINAHPIRLDTDWRVIVANSGLGLKFVVCPDAHSTAGLTDTVFGVNVARKAGLTPNDVINCLSAQQAAIFLNKRKV